MHDGTTRSHKNMIMFSPEQQVSIAATISSSNVLVKLHQSRDSGLSTYRYVKTLIKAYDSY